MKREACVLILALAVSGVGVMGQEKAKGKGKPAPTVAQPAPPPAQAKEKPKDRPAGAPGSTGQAGGGSCTPDTTAPVIAAVSATPNSIWSPNHKMTPVSITAKVTDNCSVPKENRLTERNQTTARQTEAPPGLAIDSRA